MAGRTAAKGEARRRLRLPLRLHIVGWFLLLFGALALAMGAVVSQRSQQLVDRTVSASFLGSADLALQDLRRLDETARAAAEALAANPLMQAETREERAGALHALAAILRSVPGVSATYVGWPNGDFVLLRPVGRHAQRLSAPAGAVWLVQWSGGHEDRFEFLDGALRILATRSRVDTVFDPRKRPWFVAALAKPGTIVTAPYIFFTTREPGITAARRAASGAIAGVDVSLWDLSDRLPKGRPVPSAEAAILDEEGRVLAYSDIGRLQRLIDAAGDAKGATETEALPAAGQLGSPIIAALARKLGEEKKQFFGPLTTGDGAWLATVVPLSGRGTAFVMAARTPELGSGATSIRAGLLQILGLALLLAVPVVWLAANAIARPVESFAGEVGRIAKLDFASGPSSGTRIAELAALDESIGRMRSTLRERIKELDCLYRVLELTSDTARTVPEICGDVARLLPGSFLHEDVAVARIVLDGHEHRSENWQPPVAALAAAIAGAEAGTVEVGYRAARAPQAHGEGPFLKEERDLVDAVAAHLARMLQGRRATADLAQSERLGAVGRLTGGVAHDFNNLLTVILGNAELLRESLAGQERLRALADITARAAERGAELTNRLLAFARRQALEPKLVDVDKLLAGMEGLLRRTLSEDIVVAFAREGEHCHAVVDSAQLESAVLNLCINARDAMPNGGTLTIATANVVVEAADAARHAGLEPGPYVTIAVSDTGTGMDRATLERVFEPFFTTKGVGKGSGLGLSMVYGFITQSKGHVRIDSEPGRGTTVRLYLPGAASPAAEAADREAGADAAVPAGSERILLVEDDDLVRDHVCDQLHGLGYRVVAAAGGAEALEILKRGGEFDLLFTDVVMPGMNGRELAEQARSLRPTLPVLFTSGYTEDTILSRARLDSGVHLLKKPYHRHELAAKLRAALA